ncbi:hypothetical protein P692DRAFT_2069164 [Suillus brevipes Sb2]|nr:hypothetical protein P692DRAFT_2069164 [Suillus brevipes Sb2]
MMKRRPLRQVLCKMDTHDKFKLTSIIPKGVATTLSTTFIRCKVVLTPDSCWQAILCSSLAQATHNWFFVIHFRPCRTVLSTIGTPCPNRDSDPDAMM